MRGEHDPRPNDVLVQISESQVGRALRTQSWKYAAVTPRANGWTTASADRYADSHLHVLDADPHELQNIVGSHEHAKVLSRLRAGLIERMVIGRAAPRDHALCMASGWSQLRSCRNHSPADTTRTREGAMAVVLTGGLVRDGRSEEPAEAVDDGRVVSVAAPSRTRPADDGVIVDLTGSVALPDRIDMHVHLVWSGGPDSARIIEHTGEQVTTLRANANDPAQLLAETTSVRDVGSDAMADDVVTTHEQSGVHVQR